MSSIERYLKVRFEKTTIPGLVANYKGRAESCRIF